MSVYDSSLWISDLDVILSHFSFISDLEGKTFLITGAAGLVCSAMVDLFIRYNETHQRKIRILAAGRSPEKMRNRFGVFFEKDYFAYIPYDASSTENQLDIPCDYIIHGAGNSSPDRIVKEPVETMLSNFLGIKNLLDYAKDRGVKRVLYISSSEVYGKKEDDQPYSENKYGYIDLLNSRNSYSVGKQAAETLCVSYAAEYGVDSVIARPGHVYGPTASPADQHVSSTWAYAAARKKDIVMKSDGSQRRSYCYCLDCASAILTILLYGRGSAAYNISNSSSVITIRELGEILADSAGIQMVKELPSDSEKKGFNPMSNSSLDSSALQSLGWHGLFGAKAGLEHTVLILREILKKEI